MAREGGVVARDERGVLDDPQKPGNMKKGKNARNDSHFFYQQKRRSYFM